MNLTRPALILGLSLVLGLSALGYLAGKAAIQVKEYERSVTVKGLSEREYPADIVIWPLQYTEAGNSLEKVYAALENNNARIKAFLVGKGIPREAISVSPPAVTDKSAQAYGSGPAPEFRYSAVQAVTVYSPNVAVVRAAMADLGELGKEGIAFTGGNYEARTEYLFTRLNEVKPGMIEEATNKAREVAMKFAEDSNSRLGKIRRASQGQFSIGDRDNNNPHIKKVRVVSTIEYYLSD